LEETDPLRIYLEEVAATPDEDKPTFVFPTLDEVDRAMFGSAMFG
jgi:hypothetical protein